MKITKRQLKRIIKEAVGPDLFADVQSIIDSGSSAIMDMDKKLQGMGHRDATYVSAMGMRFVEVTWMGQKYTIISKNSVTPDASTKIIGPYAVGVMG